MDDDDDRIAALVNWAVSHGAVLHPSVEVYRDAQTGLSFRVRPGAAEGLQPLEPVVRVPGSLSLSYLDAVAWRARESGGGGGGRRPPPLHPEVVAGAPPHVAGRLLLIAEHLAGTASFWHPYLQCLPQPGRRDRQAWALPPFWDADDARLLEGTNVAAGVAKVQADVAREFALADELLRAWHPVGDALRDAFSPDLYHWAYCVFSSRSFRAGLVLPPGRLGNDDDDNSDGDGDDDNDNDNDNDNAALPAGLGADDFSVLLPLLDLGNHDMTADVRWDVDSLVDGGSVVLRVARHHRPGDQVFNNYSLKTNAELLLGYGFMVPTTDALHNDYTHVRKRADSASSSPSASSSSSAAAAAPDFLLSLRPLSHPSSLVARAKQTLHLDPSTPVLSSFRHLQPEMVWDILCTLTTAPQRRELMPVPDGHHDPDGFHRHIFFSGRGLGPAAREYLEHTVAIIQHQILRELQRLNDTDVELVDHRHLHALTPNQRLALDYRARCRNVLDAVLDAIRSDGIFPED